MTKMAGRNQIIIRRDPLLGSTRKGRIAEVAGGTAAECVAVWCCCPCTVVNLVVTVVYKLPVGICRKAIRRRRKQRMMKKPSFAVASPRNPFLNVEDCDEAAMVVVDKELVELEKEMWDMFYRSGFWRSPSLTEKLVS